jgi:hypothetical protein
VYFGHINEGHGHSVNEVASLVEDLLVCMEMFVFAFGYLYAYPVTEFMYSMDGMKELTLCAPLRPLQNRFAWRNPALPTVGHPRQLYALDPPVSASHDVRLISAASSLQQATTPGCEDIHKGKSQPLEGVPSIPIRSNTVTVSSEDGLLRSCREEALEEETSWVADYVDMKAGSGEDICDEPTDEELGASHRPLLSFHPAVIGGHSPVIVDVTQGAAETVEQDLPVDCELSSDDSCTLDAATSPSLLNGVRHPSLARALWSISVPNDLRYDIQELGSQVNEIFAASNANVNVRRWWKGSGAHI